MNYIRNLNKTEIYLFSVYFSNGKNKMRKFFVRHENIKEDVIEIVGSDVNHIKNVLRLRIGDQIQICNQDTQKNYLCEIRSMDKEVVQLKRLEKLENTTEGNVKLDIFQGLPKADKMEFVLQKGTELGVSKFIPVAFKRSIVKLSGKDETKKIERWQKIAEMAAKQAKRDLVPEVEYLIPVKEICAFVPEYDVVLVAYEEEKQNYIKNELFNIKNTKENLKIAVVIGPEGGIEKEEVEILKKAGAKIVSLGKRILRTETVALQMASVIMYELEN